MARPIWKGYITFGLVNVPVTLYSAETRSDLKFQLIDSRNAARVRYQRVNAATGEEVPWENIVKGYEHEDQFVLLSDKELEKAAVERTRTIDIEQFVDLHDIDVVYFDKPYYLVPDKGGEKGYVLLREAMARSGKVGIARVVIRTRQYLAALIPEHDALVLNLLRFQTEVRPTDEFKFPTEDLKAYRVSPKEVQLAEQLIEGMTDEWKPEKFHDEYRGELMKLIESKIKAGQLEAVSEPEEEEAEEPVAGTINFMDLLKKSMDKKGKPRRASSKSASRRKSSGRKTG